MGRRAFGSSVRGLTIWVTANSKTRALAVTNSVTPSGGHRPTATKRFAKYDRTFIQPWCDPCPLNHQQRQSCRVTSISNGAKKTGGKNLFLFCYFTSEKPIQNQTKVVYSGGFKGKRDEGGSRPPPWDKHFFFINKAIIIMKYRH